MNAIRIPEDEIDAPLADAMLHVLSLHTERPRNTQQTDRTIAAIAAMYSYDPADPFAVPDSLQKAVTDACDWLTEAHRIVGEMLDMTGHDHETWAKRGNLADRVEFNRDNARTILRHKITLEGPDL